MYPFVHSRTEFLCRDCGMSDGGCLEAHGNLPKWMMIGMLVVMNMMEV